MIATHTCVFTAFSRGAVESPDTQMLFDPAEEQFDLPAGAVELRDDQGRELKIVGEKDQAQVFLGVEVVNAPQGRGIATRTLGSGEANGLIGTQARGMIDPPPRASDGSACCARRG